MSMQHHELTEFDAACRRSLDDADAWLDRFLDRGGCTTKGCLPGGVGKPAYPPQRTTDCFDDDLVSTETRHSSTRLLLLAAGAAAEVSDCAVRVWKATGTVSKSPVSHGPGSMAAR